MKYGLPVVVFCVVFLFSCRLGKQVNYSGGQKITTHYVECPRRSTSYTVLAKTVYRDSANNRLQSRETYLRHNTCFSRDDFFYREIRFDSAGNRSKVKPKRYSRSNGGGRRIYTFGDTLYSPLHIQIKAKNLSEDRSKISSGNDEVLLLVLNRIDYPGDSFSRPSLLLAEEFILDSLHRGKEIHLRNVPAHGYLYFLLIETDTDRGKDSIANIVMQNLDSIPPAQPESHLRWLGDDDLLGFYFENPSRIKDAGTVRQRFKGNHLFDKYEYEMKISL